MRIAGCPAQYNLLGAVCVKSMTSRPTAMDRRGASVCATMRAWTAAQADPRAKSTDADDMRALLAAGVSRNQIEDALAVCFTFNVVDWLSRTFEFLVLGPEAFEAAAKFLLARGYR